MKLKKLIPQLSHDVKVELRMVPPQFTYSWDSPKDIPEEFREMELVPYSLKIVSKGIGSTSPEEMAVQVAVVREKE